LEFDATSANRLGVPGAETSDADRYPKYWLNAPRRDGPAGVTARSNPLRLRACVMSGCHLDFFGFPRSETSATTFGPYVPSPFSDLIAVGFFTRTTTTSMSFASTSDAALPTSFVATTHGPQARQPGRVVVVRAPVRRITPK
jgi:hypothetical protein